jgi:hypothetical protein
MADVRGAEELGRSLGGATAELGGRRRIAAVPEGIANIEENRAEEHGRNRAKGARSRMVACGRSADKRGDSTYRIVMLPEQARWAIGSAETRAG